MWVKCEDVGPLRHACENRRRRRSCSIFLTMLNMWFKPVKRDHSGDVTVKISVHSSINNGIDGFKKICWILPSKFLSVHLNIKLSVWWYRPSSAQLIPERPGSSQPWWSADASGNLSNQMPNKRKSLKILRNEKVQNCYSWTLKCNYMLGLLHSISIFPIFTISLLIRE